MTALDETDATLRASLHLVTAWESALGAAHRLGHEIGYAAGYAAAEKQMADAWRHAADSVRKVLAQPTRDELARRRGDKK